MQHLDHHSRRPAAGVAPIATLVVVGAALWFGAHVGHAARDQHPEVLPRRRDTAVVAGLRETGGWSLFGVRITGSTAHVEVRLLADPGCAERLRSGDPWPAHVPQCASPVSTVGTVSGLGVTLSGESLVGVDFDVSQACFRLLELGAAWPTTDRNCTVR